MYWISASNDSMSGNCRAFEADTSADVRNLPTSIREGVQQGNDVISCQKVEKGSVCLVLNPASYYKLNSENEWIQL